MERVITVNLRGMTVPEALPHRRGSPVPEACRDAAYARLQDDRTLFYDCVRLPQGRLITAPRFGGLWPVFRDGLRRDGKPVRGLRRRRIGRCEQVLVRGPGELTVTLGSAIHPVIERPGLAGHFAGTNALVTASKNNDLEWVQDWARFHITSQDADSVLLFDNGSDAYGVDQIAGALRAIPGLRRAAVVSAPFLWGGHFTWQGRRERLHYLQVSLLNLARQDMLAQARAVLGIDIDELITGPEGESVFDAVRAAPLGALSLPGQWIFPEPGAALPGPHRINLYRPPEGLPCMPKWAAVPGRGLSRWMGWKVHDVGGALTRRWPSRRFGLLHCASVTTGWKSASKRHQEVPGLRCDPELERLMARYFGG